MKQITIQFDVSDNVSDREILQTLATSITLKMYNANTVMIEKPMKGTHDIYDLEPIRRDIRRFPQ